VYMSVCRISLPDGRTRLVVDGPFLTAEEGIAAKADALQGTRYSVAMTDTYLVDDMSGLMDLAHEQLVNVFRAYAPEP